jgi:hypothetical protein
MIIYAFLVVLIRHYFLSEMVPQSGNKSTFFALNLI